MPNPFSINKNVPKDIWDITNSTLVCEKCFEETDSGKYWPEQKLLIFTCPNGHRNEVRNVEI